MISILTWVSIITGGILVLLLLFSILGGMDIDIDIDTGGGDTDTSAGGLGLIKGSLTFISVSSWVMKVLLLGQQGKTLSIFIGVVSGLLVFTLLNYLLKFLIKNEENVNWKTSDALFQKGTTYLKIPSKGQGIIHVEINGASRELKAKSSTNEEIKTGESIIVIETVNDIAIVEVNKS